ncbi:MAG: MbtH protein [Actinomycetota bacterium]|nr:MbtH protein [Actinomycetota bacterium]
MGNPFDDEDGTFLVLVNERRQHCLWPSAVPVPAGWRTALASATRPEALDYVEANWLDLRPAGLVAHAGTDASR